jgi:hypothetical protein
LAAALRHLSTSSCCNHRQNPVREVMCNWCLLKHPGFQADAYWEWSTTVEARNDKEVGCMPTVDQALVGRDQLSPWLQLQLLQPSTPPPLQPPPPGAGAASAHGKAGGKFYYIVKLILLDNK